MFENYKGSGLNCYVKVEKENSIVHLHSFSFDLSSRAEKNSQYPCAELRPLMRQGGFKIACL